MMTIVSKRDTAVAQLGKALCLVACVSAVARPATAAATVSLGLTLAEVADASASNSASQSALGGETATATLPGLSSTTTSVLTPTHLSVDFDHLRTGTLQS